MFPSGTKKKETKKSSWQKEQQRLSKKIIKKYIWVLARERRLSCISVSKSCFLLFFSFSLLLSSPFFSSFLNQQLRLVLCWIIIRFCITTFCLQSTKIHPTKPHSKHQWAVHRRLWDNRSSITTCCHGSHFFREIKNLFSKWWGSVPHINIFLLLLH